MNADCWMCLHYCQKSWLVTTGVRNVSGGLAKFRKWSKHRCSLKQEDLYPRDCNFKLNQKKMDELNKKYPDLALASKKLGTAEEFLQELKLRRGR